MEKQEEVKIKEKTVKTPKEEKKKSEAKEETSSETEKKPESKREKKPTQEEYEKKIFELEKKGLTSEKIGQELKNQGIHPKEYSKKISQILKDKYVSPDLKNVEEKLKRIQNHVENNKQDKRAKREKDRVFSQVRKIKKHLGVEILKIKEKNNSLF